MSQLMLIKQIIDTEEFWKKKYETSVNYFKAVKELKNPKKVAPFKNQLLIKPKLKSNCERLSWKNLFLSGILLNYFFLINEFPIFILFLFYMKRYINKYRIRQ